MQLWTEYEGATIDGAFPLQKLLLPEGRSAFFSTASPKGEPTVVRLIECHFDEDEILARWRCVEALNHPNFLKFERYGQIELDGGPVVYAVFEKVDANLAEVLDQGHLTVKDAAQLASSLVDALEVLHTLGFVHEHIEPRNLFAVGEVVRLRTDCIREAPEGEEGRAAKQRDVHDLATVLLQSLTQRQSLDGIPDFAVPPPFGQIIRNGLDGTWGLEKIRVALQGQRDGRLDSTASVAPEAGDESVRNSINDLGYDSVRDSVDKSVGATAATPAVPVSASARVPTAVYDQAAPRTAPARPSMRPDAQLSLLLGDEELGDEGFDEGQRAKARRVEDRRAEYAGATNRRSATSRRDIWDDEEQTFSMRSRWAGAIVMVAILLILSIWGLAHAWNAHRHEAAKAASEVSQPAGQSAKQIAARHISTSPWSKPSAATFSRASHIRAANSRADWRVIVFTYNRRTDAEKKVASLARSHPDLRPAVFSVHGHAPYLVSIGGVMDRDAAYALARRSRALGLPHDTYAQNYSH